jgi:23S rRNA-/tRNA-specific pseudouridylate synthase
MQRDLSAAVLYEDERLLVLNKPSGIAVHGGSGISAGVIETLRASRPGSELELVHRLDRDTSGCLLISKRRSALRELHRQMRDGLIDKRYQALLVGSLPRRLVQVDLPLRKNQLRGGERMVQVDPAGGKTGTYPVSQACGLMAAAPWWTCNCTAGVRTRSACMPQAWARRLPATTSMAMKLPTRRCGNWG